MPIRFVSLIMLLIVGLAVFALPPDHTSALSHPTATPTPAFAALAPIRLAFAPQGDLPYLVTAGGAILEPGTDEVWHVLPLDAVVHDMSFDVDGVLWMATDSGLFTYQDGAWQKQDDQAFSRLVSSHGYLFCFGNEGILRGPEHWRMLDAPGDIPSGSDLVMLADHSHVLQSGEDVFRTNDMGLSWTPLDAPGPVRFIWSDLDGNLLAAGDETIWLWDDGAWRDYLPLPDGQPITAMRNFRTLYAIAGGKLYRLEQGAWQPISLPEADNAVLTAIASRRADSLWVVDAAGARLWFSPDGDRWTALPVRVD